MSSRICVISAARMHRKPNFCASMLTGAPLAIIFDPSGSTPRRNITSSGRSESQSLRILSARLLTSSDISARTAEGLSCPTRGGTTSSMLQNIRLITWSRVSEAYAGFEIGSAIFENPSKRIFPSLPTFGRSLLRLSSISFRISKNDSHR